jgi:hypothetical protein
MEKTSRSGINTQDPQHELHVTKRSFLQDYAKIATGNCVKTKEL